MAVMRENILSLKGTSQYLLYAPCFHDHILAQERPSACTALGRGQGRSSAGWMGQVIFCPASMHSATSSTGSCVTCNHLDKGPKKNPSSNGPYRELLQSLLELQVPSREVRGSYTLLHPTVFNTSFTLMTSCSISHKPPSIRKQLCEKIKGQ